MPAGFHESLHPYTGQYDAVVYELDSLSFIDVAGLRSIDTAPDAHAPITGCDPSRPVRRLLDLAGRKSMIDTASTHLMTLSVVGEGVVSEQATAPTAQALDLKEGPGRSRVRDHPGFQISQRLEAASSIRIVQYLHSGPHGRGC